MLDAVQDNLDALCDNGLAGATVVALALGIWISAKTVGLLDRPKHSIRANYLPPAEKPLPATFPV